MAKREGVEIDGLFRRGLAAPLEFAGPGWERGLAGEKKPGREKRAALVLQAEMPGVMRVFALGAGQTPDDGAFHLRAGGWVGVGG